MDFNANDLESLEEYLDLNQISKDEVCLVGSATLSLIGIRKHNDIDIVIHSRNKNKNLLLHQSIERVDSPWSSLFSDDELIDNSDLHILLNGFKFVVPELVYHRKAWHNRPKDRIDIIELNEYAVMHKEWNWELILDFLPKPSFIKVSLRKMKNRYNFYNQKIREYFREVRYLHNDCIQMIPTNLLWSKQILNNKFNRFDIIVRFMAIESYLKDESFGVNLYNKMQAERGGTSYENPWKIFQKLILRVKNTGLDSTYPVLVNNNLHLVDGAHRLACALFFNKPFIAIKINKKLAPSAYALDWFESNNFTADELQLIENKRITILNDNYIYFEVVLWPTVENYFDEIQQIITDRFKIFSTKDYINIAEFPDYLRSLYQIDDIKDWKVEMKINRFSSYPRNIRIIKIDIPDPNFRYKENGQLISSEVEQLKKEIRAGYHDKVEDYFHDIIIHIGDNYSHSKQSSLIDINV
jgi:hypothetical protein